MNQPIEKRKYNIRNNKRIGTISYNYHYLVLQGEIEPFAPENPKNMKSFLQVMRRDKTYLFQTMYIFYSKKPYHKISLDNSYENLLIIDGNFASINHLSEMNLYIHPQDQFPAFNLTLNCSSYDYSLAPSSSKYRLLTIPFFSISDDREIFTKFLPKSPEKVFGDWKDQARVTLDSYYYGNNISYSSFIQNSSAFSKFQVYKVNKFQIDFGIQPEKVTFMKIYEDDKDYKYTNQVGIIFVQTSDFNLRGFDCFYEETNETLQCRKSFEKMIPGKILFLGIATSPDDLLIYSYLHEKSAGEVDFYEYKSQKFLVKRSWFIEQFNFTISDFVLFSGAMAIVFPARKTIQFSGIYSKINYILDEKFFENYGIDYFCPQMVK